MEAESLKVYLVFEAESLKVYLVLIAFGFVLGAIFATILVSYFKDRCK